MPQLTSRNSDAGIKLLVFILLLWAVSVLIIARMVKVYGNHLDFSQTGQFGDSFGFISATMASIAALFAYKTFRSQSEEIELLRLERDALRAERAEATKIKAEPAFLTLLERRYDALAQAAYRRPNEEYRRGGQAIETLSEDIRSRMAMNNQTAIQAYNYYVPSGTKNLAHLFRFTYHIILYAERHFDGGAAMGRPVTRDDLSYQFVRLLRSQLSDDEQLLIALNALTPDGAGAKPFIEKYALLHNMSDNNQTRVKAAGQWDPVAFGLP